MSDVTGPISTLPGSKHGVPPGMLCDSCQKASAVCRIQGETDSFGSEMHDYCLACYVAIKDGGAISGQCDWCKKDFPELYVTRDYDEGICGPVYYVCSLCKKAQQEQALKDYNEMQEMREEVYEDDYDPNDFASDEE